MKKIISVMLAVCLVFAAFTLPITTVSAAESNTEAEGVGAESAFLHKTGQFSAITAKSFLSVIGPGYSESNTLANHDPKLMYDDMNYPAVYIELGLGNPEHGIGFSKNVRLEQNKTVKFELDLKDMPDLPNGANYTDFTSFASVPIALEQPTTFTFELSDYRFVLPNKEIPFDNCNGLHTLSFIDGEGFIGGNAGLNMTTAELKKGKLMANITLKSIEGLSKAEFYTMNAFAPLPNAEWFEFLKSEGFNSIRFQVTWYNHTNDKTYVIDKEWLNEVEKYLNMALNAGLYCSINVNWDMRTDYKPGDMMLTEEEITALPRKSGWLTLDGDLKVEERFAEVWRQIAEHFKDYDEYLIFESMNEPNAPDYTMQELGAKGNPEGHGWDDIGKAGENLNRLNQIFVDTVRKTGGNNAKRFLFVPPFFHKGAEPSLKEFKLPTDEADHTIVCVNRYLGDEEIGGGDIYPAVDKYLLKNGVGVVITEFGSFADDYSYDERLAFSQEETQKARKSGIPIFWYGSEWGKFDDPDAPNTCLYNPYTFEPVFPELIDVLMDSSANVARAVSSPQPTSSPKPTSPSVSSSNAVEKKF
ncbi:MAG: glycoside hydrolase family 5 protein, partial [Clostridiales bacterium]|nr:glycoside hydrolase family 5 protein [Clostridiales bacterium]